MKQGTQQAARSAIPQKRTVVLATPAPVSQRTAEENLGLGYLASVLRGDGYRVKVIDGWLEGLSSEQIAERILQLPDILWVGFSCYRSNCSKALEIINLLRAAQIKVPIVAGGYGPTFYPELFLEGGFDLVARGEAEDTVLQLSRQLSEGVVNLHEIKGVCFIEHDRFVSNPMPALLTNIDALPFPSHDTLELSVKRRSEIHILSSRGCAARCLFCSIVAFMRLSDGPQWRQRSIANFVDELESLHQKGVRHFKVIDDSFLEPPRDLNWCIDLGDEIERRNLKLILRGSIRADRVTEEIVAELVRAGFIAFSCGIENFAPTALRRMSKTASLEQNLNALACFKKYGVYVQAGQILFDHATTLDELWQNYYGMQKHVWTISKGIFTEMYAAEGTPFTKLLDKKSLLERSSSVVGNNNYPVLDDAARTVYYGLKQWHKAHMKLYDKTIDPLSAPKALDGEELASFHPLCVELRQRDLAVFKDLLTLAAQGASNKHVLAYVDDRIAATAPWYEEFSREVEAVYERVHLIYDADENPFIC